MVATSEERAGTSITEILIRRGVLDPKVLAKADDERGTVHIEKYLVQKQMVSPADMTLALSEYLRMPPVSLAHFTPNPVLMEQVSPELMARYHVVPVGRVGRTMCVAMGDPFNILALDELHAMTGLTIVPLVAAEKEIQDLIARNMAAEGKQGIDLESLMKVPDGEADIEVGKEEREEESLEKTLESAEEAPVIRMVNMILVEALRTRASDIHIEPQEKSTRLRYRIDGALNERPSPPKMYHGAIVSRIKIMAELDIAERRIPQDGRIKVRALGKEVDIRVSTLPTVHGEKVVMRVLDKSNLALGLSDLGLDPFAYEALKYAIDQPHGIILVTGPTGSGKTTTLYSCLRDLNKPDVNIMTAEDPVEYELQGVNQIHVNEQVGLTFASVLRSFLRQDPDIILVGEIRDDETADIAVKAALTGHLVLSTLHTNDAAGAIARVLDMGVPPFLLASCLIVAQAQRLYRKLCPSCKKPTALPADVLKANHIDPEFFGNTTIYGPRGCPKCNFLGYKGRGAIMEVLSVDEHVREAVIRGNSTAEIRELARKNGMVGLKEAGLRKVRDGLTSLEAALEVTGGE